MHVHSLEQLVTRARNTMMLTVYSTKLLIVLIMEDENDILINMNIEVTDCDNNIYSYFFDETVNKC